MADTQVATLVTQLELRKAQMDAGLKEVQRTVKQTAKAQDKLAQSTTKAQKSVNRFGRVGQQAGVQVGDFLVQVGGGSNILLAFAQQANQLGAFMTGPWGIAFTLATGVLAAFGTKLFQTGEDVDQFEKRTAKAIKTLKDLSEESRRTRLGFSSNVFARLQDVETQLIKIANLQTTINNAAGPNRDSIIADAKERLEIEEDRLKTAEELLSRTREEEAEIVEARKAQESMLAVMEKVNAKLLESVDLTARMAANTRLAAEGAALMANIGKNPDFFDPRGEGSAGDTSGRYVPAGLPTVTLPPNPTTPRKKTGGGGKSEAEKANEKMLKDIERMTEALRKAQEQADQFGASFENSVADLGTSSIDSFISSLAQGEVAFDEFAKNMIRQLAAMILQAALLNILMSSLGGTAGAPTNGLQRIVQTMSGVSFNAKGGVIDSPTVLGMQGNKVAVGGEAGAEAVLPLQRGRDGNLGVGGPAITINNMAGADVAVVRSDEEVIEIAVQRARQASRTDFSRSMQTGSGEYARSMEQGYTSRRRVT